MTAEEFYRNVKAFWHDIEKGKLDCERNPDACPYFLRSRCAYGEETVSKTRYDGLCLILEEILQHDIYEVFGE